MSWAPRSICSAHADPDPPAGLHHPRNPEHTTLTFAHEPQTIKGDPQQFRFRGFTAQEKAFAASTTTPLPASRELLPEGEGDDDSGARQPRAPHRLGR